MKRVLLGIAVALAASAAFAQSAIIRGESAAGVYQTIITDGSQRLVVAVDGAGDPCTSSKTSKSSAVINITTAATTALVALSGTTTIFVCDFTFSISQVATTANTLKFVRGTGAACGTGTNDLTGAFGTGGITAGIPLVVSATSSGTVFKTAAGEALCATTTIGASAAFAGVLTFVQQ